MKHIMELLGKTRVVVEDGKVVEVGEPALDWCPLFDKVRGIKQITAEEVRKNTEFRIRDFGLFTDHRQLDGFDDFVSFGASEVMYSGLEHGLLDMTVTACDGAGTVLTANPSLVQGIGARISGLVYTEPIPETIAAIRQRNGFVLDENTAVIDPVSGVKAAYVIGFKKIAVTVADLKTAEEIRAWQESLKKEKGDVPQIIIIGVHTTGFRECEAGKFAEVTDICTLCASESLRTIRPLAQVGTAVPLVAFSQAGKELLLERAKYVKSPVLVSTPPLPELPEQKQPRRLS
ncbi:DUF2099 family protein [Methanosarcinaceae archaeon]|nr:DUF2099 family protein [Methanosarcinaceae archaeon]